MRGLPGRGGIGPPTALDVRCPECMGDERDGKDCSGNGRHDMRGATHVINGTCVKCGGGWDILGDPQRTTLNGTTLYNWDVDSQLVGEEARGGEGVCVDG